MTSRVTTLSPRVFYTYIWLREDGTPYYVGKGNRTSNCRGRAYRRGCPLEEERIIVQDHESEDAAMFAECFLIEFYGRKADETGCLRNITAGGDGTVGRIWTEDQRKRKSAERKGKEFPHLHTPESIEKARISLSRIKKGKPIAHYDPIAHSEKMSGYGNPWYGKKRDAFSDEWKAKLSDGKRGHFVSEETRIKMAAASKGRDKKTITHCHRGHEFTPENTWVGKSGSRFCLQCRKINHEILKSKRKTVREEKHGGV